MGKPLEHLVDIKAVPVSDLNDLIISQHKVNGQLVILSRYRDMRWNLSPYIQTRNHRDFKIIFNSRLENGDLLTDNKNKGLLESAKRFLYVRWKHKSPHSGKYISARSLFNNWIVLRPLLSWMIREGLSSFSELTPGKCLDFVRFCQAEKTLNKSTQTIAYQIITTYFDFSDHLEDKMPEYPWPDVLPTILAGNSILVNKNNKYSSTEVIPLRILKIIVQKALEYVEHKADGLLCALNGIAVIRQKVYQEKLSRHKEAHPHGFSSIYDSEEAYLQVKTGHKSTPESKHWLTENSLPDYEELEKELIRLRTACYIVSAIFSGMRDSETMSLEVGCFFRHRGFDDEEYCWLKGKTYKLEEDPKDVEWMVPPIVGKAIAVAEKLSAPIRGVLRSRIRDLEYQLGSLTLLPSVREKTLIKLSECLKYEHALFLNRRDNSLSASTINLDLKSFAKLAGAIVEISDMPSVIGKNKVAVGKPWPLSPHQLRRSFAVLVTRNLMGDIRYLREHLKHWSIDMTLYYARHEQSYIDKTLFNEILTEREKFQTIVLENWFSSNAKLSGGTGRRLVNYLGRDTIKTVTDMHEFCSKLGEDVFIRGTGHSWCMCSDSGSSGHCLYDAIRCSSCEDSVIDDTHLQVWRGIRDQQIEVLRCSDLGEPMWQRCANHLRESERILLELGDDIEPYPMPEHPYKTEVVL